MLFVQCKHQNPNAVINEEQARSRHIKLAMEYLQQHFREEITEIEVAKLLGLTPIYLSALFSETAGMPFREYLLKIRLEHAMDALLNKHMTIDHGCAAQQAHDHRGSCQGRRIPEQAHLYRKMQKSVSHHSFSAFEAKKGEREVNRVNV